MNLTKYFQETTGRGVLATSDSSGKVDIAIYSRPHIMEDDSLAFIMAEHLTYENLKSNPKACFLYVEAGGWLAGVRLYLTKIKETDDPKLVKKICKTCSYGFQGEKLSRHVVFFELDETRPLVGN